ncbi:uncharacterized protein LOC143840402 [Paroedura picta]|uniref:uncharacterized protein LOC143840402 n=1 Tax=Paroedura picta TaxID=143630 RepID=UPI004056159D
MGLSPPPLVPAASSLRLIPPSSPPPPLRATSLRRESGEGIKGVGKAAKAAAAGRATRVAVGRSFDGLHQHHQIVKLGGLILLKNKVSFYVLGVKITACFETTEEYWSCQSNVKVLTVQV